MSISFPLLAKIFSRGLSTKTDFSAERGAHISTLCEWGINVYRERAAAAPAVTHFNEHSSIGIQTNARRRWIIQGAKRAHHEFYLITRPLANWNALNSWAAAGYFCLPKRKQPTGAPLCKHQHADVGGREGCSIRGQRIAVATTWV